MNYLSRTYRSALDQLSKLQSNHLAKITAFFESGIFSMNTLLLRYPRGKA